MSAAAEEPEAIPAFARRIARRRFPAGGLVHLTGNPQAQAFLACIGCLFIEFAVLLVMYRRKIFLKI